MPLVDPRELRELAAIRAAERRTQTRLAWAVVVVAGVFLARVAYLLAHQWWGW